MFQVVPLAIASPRVVKDAEVNDGANIAAAEDVFHLLAPHVDLVVDDVLGSVRRKAADRRPTTRSVRWSSRDEKPAEAPAHAGHQHGALARPAAPTRLGSVASR